MTTSGERVKAVQYALAARPSTCRRRAVAWAASSSARSTSDTVSPCAWRKCAIGALESTTTWREPGRLMTASGRTVAPCRLTLRHLLVEVAAGEEPRELEHAPQLHLAPGAADRRGVEGGREGRGLGAQRLGRPAHLGEALAELPELERPVALERADLPLDAADGVAQRERAGSAVVSSTSRADSRSATRSRRTSRSASAPAERASSVERADSHASRPPTSAPMTSPTSQSGEVHASTVPDAADTVARRARRRSAARAADGIRPGLARAPVGVC